MKASGIPISERTVGLWRVELPAGNWLAHLFHNSGFAGPDRTPETAWRGAQARRLAALPVHIMCSSPDPT